MIYGTDPGPGGAWAHGSLGILE